jgi:cytoskeleton-associated protein 5
MDGPPPQEEDFSSLPIEDRLSHKNWKARFSAYESLIKTFQLTVSDTDPAFKPYLNNTDVLKKIVTDTNAVSQEKGIECLVALVKFAGENAARTREVVVPALVDKCYGSARAGTRNHAIELSLQYVEVENNAAGVVVRTGRILKVDERDSQHFDSGCRIMCSLVWLLNSPRLCQGPSLY